MPIAVTVAAVTVAVVALVWAVVTRRRTAARHARLQVTIETLTGDLDAARIQVAAEAERAATLLRERDEARAARAELAAEVDVLRGERDRTAAELAAATDPGHDPVTLWQLEIARTERTWRHHVAPGAHLPVPFGGTDSALLVAARIDAAALREETGTTADIVWLVDGDPGPAASLAALRRVQELLAWAAKTAEHVEVVLAGPADRILVTATATDAEGARHPVELPAPAAFVE